MSDRVYSFYTKMIYILYQIQIYFRAILSENFPFFIVENTRRSLGYLCPRTVLLKALPELCSLPRIMKNFPVINWSKIYPYLVLDQSLTGNSLLFRCEFFS
jgi:hypothetical protein